jgi:hypothetical protein
MKESYGTLTETILGLKREGYTIDFNLGIECLVYQEIPIILSPDEFIIDKVYRFEGASNPDDQSILYAISSSKYNAKGLLVNGYGISAVKETHALIEKLRTHDD